MRLQVPQIRAVHSLEEIAKFNPDNVLGTPPTFVKFHQPLNVQVQAQLTQTNILVTGHTSMSATLNCGRCLVDYTLELKGEFQETFSFDLDVIDLTDLIRESILIDLPLRGLCKDTCKGLCEKCGVNKNIETCRCTTDVTHARWDALKQFRFKQ